MGFDAQSKAKTYTPIDGDTLQAIAERETEEGNPLTWQDIARFNWGTDDEAVVNECMRDELGCRWRDANNNFVISTGDDVNNPLRIPLPFQKPGLALNQTHVIRVRMKQAPPQFLECCAIPGATFAFDKSFLRASVVDHLQPIEDALAAHPDALLMVFGHTDKVGDEAYNKDLSERRALSVFAFITNDPDTWEMLYNQEQWGTAVIQEILKDLDVPAFDPGPVDGIYGSQTQAAVHNYQEARGLTVDGNAGPETRRQLFTEYMTSKHDIAVTADQFMDPKHMGCGEFNPVEATEGASEANRRVTLFLFHKDRPPKLPCGHGDLAPCHKQMDPPSPRFTPTFACSFFDSLAHKCGCETPGTTTARLRIRLLDGAMIAMPNAVYRLTIGQEVREGTADGEGRLVEPDVTVPASCTVAWGRAEDVEAASGTFPYRVDVFLDFDQGGATQTAEKRLHNLGYDIGDALAYRIRLFQIDYHLPLTGQLDAPTLAALLSAHDDGVASDEI